MHKPSLTLEPKLAATWTMVQGALTSLCGAWAGRRDVIVRVGMGSGTSWFDPMTAQVEINREQAFPNVDPLSVGDLRDRSVLSEYPVAGGLTLHEAMHARHQTADLRELRDRLLALGGHRLEEVATLLEETRVEGRGVKRFPRDRGYLRASAKTLILDSGEDKWSPRFAALVLMNRYAVGVLDAADVAPVKDYLLAQPLWTTAIIDTVMARGVEFCELEDSGAELERQIAIAQELDELMPVDPPEPDQSALEEMIAAILGALGRAERGGIGEVMDVAAEDREIEAAREREQERTRTAQNKSKADSVFRMPDGSGPSSIPERLLSNRVPTVQERQAAIKLSKALASAKYRDRSVEEFRTATPPGRFHSSEAMRLDAARTLGGPVGQYKPFRHRKRVHTDEPPLTVGVMDDISGSMRRVQPAVGVATWILSDAVSRINEATAAQVYYGEKVYPGLHKGEKLDRVPTWQGSAGWEEFDGAFRALDGELDLLNGSGARLLVIMSDGGYRPTQIEAANRWMRACVKAGVGVLWLDLYDGRGKTFCEEAGKGAQHLKVGTDLLGTIDAIGAAAVTALSEANSGG